MVKGFYSNVAHILKGTKVTKVRNKNMIFTGKALNEYLGFVEEDESLYNEKLAMGEEVHPWLASYLAIPGTVPEWLQAGAKIHRRTFNFEARAWLTFVCSRLDPTTHDQTIPLVRAILVASIMARYLINVGNVMSRVIFAVGVEYDRNYPFPSTFTMYFRDLKVEKRPFDIKVKPVAPFSWYSLKGSDNPKDKNYKPPASAPTGQSEEPVAVKPSTEPTSTVADMPSGPSTTTGPSTSAGPEIPSSRAHPITAHQLSQTLLSLNNWMSVASSKLSTFTYTIAAQSAPQPAQLPQSIEDTLNKILENQEKIISTQGAMAKAVDSHGKALKEIAREHKKLRKTRASKKSVKELRADVDKLMADQMPLDLLFGDPAPVAAPVVEPQQEQTQRLPRKKRKLPSADEAIIRLAYPQEVSSSQPQVSLDIQPVQVQAPVPAAEQ
ncbi:uncharacterized protein LOC142162809 [Nicotiana tabacum]|uniref:Uncharacterized protein LOC142162809 n=3 Tax=Nicotiana tabacum TaxID=4097 RepID=A0AC58RST5_TOBAC